MEDRARRLLLLRLPVSALAASPSVDGILPLDPNSDARWVPIEALRKEVPGLAATSRAMIEALRKAGGKPRFTEYPGVGHSAFMWAYTEPALVEWLFAQSR